jgi:peptide chain release factor subunit 1
MRRSTGRAKQSGYNGAMSVTDFARRLAEQRTRHPVISLYLDLDPEEFATPPARESEVHSLIDGARPDVETDESLDHEDKIALREDLDRVRDYLLSDEPPFQGARALAVFASRLDSLFEVVQLRWPVPGRAVVASKPYIEPLLQAVQAQRWCAVVVSRDRGLILTGWPDDLVERERVRDNVHGRVKKGGPSQANYERSAEQDAEAHLRRVADEVYRLWQAEGFDRLAVGGPHEDVTRFEQLLHNDLRPRLAPGRLAVDESRVTDAQIGDALTEFVTEESRRRERESLDLLAERLGVGERAAGGPEATLEALNERRVEVLLLERGVARPGGRCPSDGLLTLQSDGACPADGTALEPIADIGEAAIEAALLQDAEVILVERYPDLGPHQGFAALLRF